MSIFRRMFSRKDNTETRKSTTKSTLNGTKIGNNGKNTSLLSSSMSSSTSTILDNSNNNYRQATTAIKYDNKEIKSKNFGNFLPNSPKKSLRRDDKQRSLSVLQLTPLWEHIINTRTLPDNINPNIMFNEFLERLRDPEWQVRQHALRVLVDVLLVIGHKADVYFDLLLPQLIENLGHSAPTVRKGALDCLRVYLTETAMPESVLLQILDIGLNQRITNEPFGGRLTCGVMLSLPSLVQATMGSTKRNFILKTTIDMLINKMTQITHQEITLKVLLKFKELLGEEEFTEYVTAAEYREFELLCSVYGITGSNHINYQTNGADFKKSWQIIPSFDSDDRSGLLASDLLWKSSDDEDNKGIDLALNDTTQLYSFTPIPPSEIFGEDEPKVILETEIKINNDTVTMRILEANDDTFINDCNFHDNPLIVRSEETTPTIKEDLSNVEENSGLIQVLTDSELDEINKNAKPPDPNVLSTPKRVTFGGEIVKMRTPDSDGTTAASDIDVIDLSQIKSDNNFNATKNMVNKSQSLQESSNNDINQMNRPTSGVIHKPEKIKSAFEMESKSVQTTTSTVVNPLNNVEKSSPVKSNTNEETKSKPTSPKSPFKRMTVSPVDKLLSPKAPHKEIEVLHNLQREISPNRPKDIKQKIIDIGPIEHNLTIRHADETKSKEQNIKINSWEDLGLVDNQTLQNLRSGDWQRRSQAIEMISESLKPPENLLLIQPYLESLLRTLLSSERNSSVSEDKRKVLINLISRLPLDNLEKRTVQILTGLCRQGGPGSNRVSKLLMQRLSPSAIVLKLLSNEFLYTRSSKFRDNALQVVMYALMTFPSTSFDTPTCVIGATYAALDSKKRVRQAALDILAILGQVASPRTVMEIVQRVTELHNSIDKGKIDNRTNTNEFLTAVKARLSRKQLPNIASDDTIIYALRIPSPNYSNNYENLQKIPADLKWIASGIGSVSPTAIKKRSQKFHTSSRQQSYATESNGNYRSSNDVEIKKKIYGNSGPHEVQNYGIENDIIKNEERSNRYKEISTTGRKYSTDNRDDLLGASSRKNVFGQFYSDSSQDDRSSDSTYYTYESSFKNSMLSRFPSMEKHESSGIPKSDQQYHNPYSINNSHVSFYKKTSKFIPKKFNKIISQPSVYMIGDNSNESTFSSSFEKNSYAPRRFASFEKLNTSNKPPQQPFIISNNVYKTTIVGDVNSKREKQIFTETQKSPKDSFHKSKVTTPTTTTPILTKKSPAISTISHEIPITTTSSDNLEIINFENEEYTESSELSSDDRLNSSGHSTPTRVLTDRMTPLSLKEFPNKISENTQQNQLNENSKSNSAKSKILSRPPSSYSNKSIKSFRLEEEEIDKIDLTDTIKTFEMDTEYNIKDDVDSNFEMFENTTAENLENSFSPSNHLKSEENSLDAKSIGTESRTETEQFSIETVIMANSKEEDVQSHTVVEIEMKEAELESVNVQPEQNLIETKRVTTPIFAAALPTMLPSNSRTKSSDFIQREIENKDSEIDLRSSTSTETSSDYQQSTASADFLLNHQQNFSPVKTMMRKSKTTIFSRKNRRVSPVKQSIKHSKIELYPQTLSKFEKPKEALSLTFHQLESPDWEIVMDGLVDIIRLIRHHSDILEPHCHLVCMHLAKSVKNLRSQVSRAACQASTEYFTVRSKFIEQECDDLVGNLLHRTADTNKFLRADAERALESMCDNLPPPKVLNILTSRGITHQNAIVRTAVAKLLNRLAGRIGCDKVYQMPREQKEKVFLSACTLLMEGSLETRSYAKALLRSLSDHPFYNKSILDYIPPRMYRNIEKSLKSIKP